MLFVPLVPSLNSHRWGLVFLMLIGRIPAAPLGASDHRAINPVLGEVAVDLVQQAETLPTRTLP